MRLRPRLLAIAAAALVAALVASVASTTTSRSFVSLNARAASRPLDLVWISDSSGWGAASLFARQIRQDRGVVVRVHDEWVGGLQASTILTRLRARNDPWVRLIRDAEVIVVWGNPVGSGDKTVDQAYCALTMSAPPKPGPKTFATYTATLQAIYERIFAIRKGAPVILRTYTPYVPIIYHAPSELSGLPSVSWKQAGIVEQCTRWQEALTKAMTTAASAYRVPVADVYAAFNGRDHRGDPVAKGYIQSDGVHPSDAGRAVIATTIAKLGYAPVKPRSP